MVEVGAWTVVGAGAAVAATQVTGWSRSRFVAIAQSLTPLLAAAAVPVATVGVLRRRPALAASAATVALTLGSVVAPAIRRFPATVPASPGDLRVLHANLLFGNIRRAPEAAAAVLATGADVLALSELTTHHRDALLALGAAETYPFRYDKPSKLSEGLALWSRFPLSDLRVRLMDIRPGLSVHVDAPGGPVRLVLAHPDPPTMLRGLRRWESSLELIGAVVAGDPTPTVLVADLNASRWHPPFRRLLATGLRDAHELAGRGLGTSWPKDSRLVPSFIRLDHALLGPGLDLVDLRDVVVPGSDHLGFVVTLSRANGSR